MFGVALPVHDQFGMHSPEVLRNMAIPAHRLVRGKKFWQLFRANVAPLPGFEIWSQQSRGMVQVMQRSDLLVAEDATLPFVPPRDDSPDQAVLGISLDLLHAVLPAVLAFRPAGTFFQVQCCNPLLYRFSWMKRGLR